MRPAWLGIVLLALLGCRPANRPPAPQPPAPQSQPPKTAIVQALMCELGRMRLPPPQARCRDALCRSLRASDAELAKVLGGNSRQLILRANCKPQVRVPVEPSRPPAP